MAGVCPLGAVGVSWHTKREMDGKDETALWLAKTNLVGDARLSVDDVGKSLNHGEIERKKISKESDAPVYGAENEAEGSIESIESTSKTMVATDTEMNTFTFQ